MEKCSGLPLALRVIGRALSTKKTPEEWQHMINLLTKLDVKTITSMEETLLSKLKLSYDNLIDDTLRDCFLCCALWPEDERISPNDLIEYWIGSGLIDDFENMGEAFNKGYSFIGNLNEACLLEFEYGYGNYYVKLHDVIRDMAMWIVSEYRKKKNKWVVVESNDDMRKFSKWEASNWKEAELIWFKGFGRNIESFLNLLSVQNINENGEASSATISPRYPNLKYLLIPDILAKPNPRPRPVINFFPHMPSLIYLSLSGGNILDLSKEIRVLINLRYLSISNTDIESLPPEIEELKELKYFICKSGRKIKNGLSAISRLPKLQVLDLYDINACLEANDLNLLKKRVKAIGMNVKSVEVLGLLKDLPTWKIGLANIQNMPILNFCDLSYKHDGEGLMELSIYDCGFEELLINGNGVSLKEIFLEHLEKLKQITWSTETILGECFRKLSFVYIQNCNSLRNLSFVLHLPCLGKLEVHDCSAMVGLIDPADQMRQASSSSLATFPSLRSLTIWRLSNLVSLSTCPLDFPVLSKLSLLQCPKLKKLPFKPSIVNNKFSYLHVDKESWEGLEWEDTTILSHLTNFWSYDHSDSF